MYKDKKTILRKAVFFIMISAVCIIWLMGLISARKQPVYKAWFEIGEPGEYFFEVNDVNQKIIQEFEVPYDDVFEKASIMIGTHSGKSRSQWKAELFEGEQDEPIYERTFESEKLKDNSYFNIINKEIEVNHDVSYKLVITPLKIQGGLGLAFYADENGKQGYLSGGDSEERFDLALRVYCCSDRGWFWAGVYIAVSLFAVLIFVRIWFLHKKKIPCVQDLLLQTMVLIFLNFFLHFGGLDADVFMDENDNIRGGMVIANGGVLYKDYITQHTPFMYYLCAVFAKLGAGSVPQFRILYYMFCALFAGLIYLRNGEKFGKCRIALFVVWQPIISYLIHSNYGLRILSDNVQAMAIVMLLLEYLSYRKKPGIGIKRSVVVSIAIFVSFGCAFLSIYPIAVICLSVILNEAFHIKKKHRRRRRPVSYYVKRYRKLVLVCILPFVLFMVYFAINGALYSAYAMAYQFNIDVYEKYIHMGGNKLELVFIGIKRFFQAIIENAASLFEQFTLSSFVCLLLLLIVSFCIGMELWKKNYLKGITIFLFLCLCYARDDYSSSFHLAAFWNTALLIVILYVGRIKVREINERWVRAMTAVAVLAVSFMIYMPYGPVLWDNISSDHAVGINELEKYVVDHTDDGDIILVDFSVLESIYLPYKDRFSISRVPYFLPWYMDWYQDEVIKDIQVHKPKFILYNPDQKVWGIDGFLEPMRKQVNKDYIMDKRTGIYYRK